MSVAQHLNKKVYVDKTRWKMMLCYDEWSAQEQGRLTTDNTCTNLHVVPLNHINFNYMLEYKQKIRNQKGNELKGISRIVAFSPSGWNFGGKSSWGSGGSGGKSKSLPRKDTGGTKTGMNTGIRSNSSLSIEPQYVVSTGTMNTDVTVDATENIIKRRDKNNDIIFNLPYSEHSSYTELGEFVECFKPVRIIPTVNTRKDKVTEQLNLLKHFY